MSPYEFVYKYVFQSISESRIFKSQSYTIYYLLSLSRIKIDWLKIALKYPSNCLNICNICQNIEIQFDTPASSSVLRQFDNVVFVMLWTQLNLNDIYL